MHNKKLLLSAALTILSSISCFGWGQKGHDTVAFIAENHLTSATKTAIDSLLDGKSIVYWSNWLDNASNTPEYGYSKTWHYKNIDAGVEYKDAPLNSKGDVVTAINKMVQVIQNPKKSSEEKSTALKMLVHLVGDIHQPMHMGHLSDLGGNRWFIKYFGSNNKLHSIWDSSLVESAHKWTYTEWQQQIDRARPAQEAEIIAEGTPDKWGEECYKIATEIYDTTPQESEISYNYIATWTPVIETQLLRGGLRLADLLNSLFDNDYKPSNLIVKRK